MNSTRKTGEGLVVHLEFEKQSQKQSNKTRHGIIAGRNMRGCRDLMAPDGSTAEAGRNWKKKRASCLLMQSRGEPRRAQASEDSLKTAAERTRNVPIQGSALKRAEGISTSLDSFILLTCQTLL